MSQSTMGSHAVNVAEIEQRARRLLQANEVLRTHADKIYVSVRPGRVVLDGRLPSFYLKQVLQTVFKGAGLCADCEIANRVEVVAAAKD